ncbi:tetratricopeptide repeat protein [Raineya orbicola]|uniref:DnaJ domain n=1 Tax=Raineya orbicola TaxID=2016530 RepID=A0A2N3IKT2_9BACT|nr:DnaJ domain-containing protein [Raineya orbicola]PKQ70935.1 DnaJ domain [Raineya orbicola]
MNYYEILGVSPQASLLEIKNAYKKLAFRYHPDQNPNDAKAEEMFKKINEAYQTLSDAQKRHFYDVKLGFTQEINYSYYYQDYQKKQEAEQKVKVEILKNFFRKYQEEQKAEQKEIEKINKKTNFWIALALVLILLPAIYLTIQEKYQLREMYAQAQIYLRTYQLRKADSLVHLIRRKKPKDLDYLLLYVKVHFKMQDYKEVFRMLDNSYLIKSPDFRFYWAISRYKYQREHLAETIQVLQEVEKSGFRESDLYFERAMIKFSLNADSKSICQDLELALKMGEFRAAHYQFICP